MTASCGAFPILCCKSRRLVCKLRKKCLLCCHVILPGCHKHAHNCPLNCITRHLIKMLNISTPQNFQIFPNPRIQDYSTTIPFNHFIFISNLHDENIARKQNRLEIHNDFIHPLTTVHPQMSDALENLNDISPPQKRQSRFIQIYFAE